MITQEQLKNLLDYSPETGNFTWNVAKKGAAKNKKAGSINKNGYITICVNYKQYYAHRLAWLYVYGDLPEHIDHINNIRSDNRICNLREANFFQNSHNTKISKRNNSGIKGITFNKNAKKWCASIMSFSKKIHIGYFENLIEAENAINLARKKYHMEFANHG
jgi:hypothetical protein